jgi:hypothetical protein
MSIGRCCECCGRVGAFHICRRAMALVRLVPPHPDPLPRGEGETFGASRRILNRLELTLRPAGCSLSPRAGLCPQVGPLDTVGARSAWRYSAKSQFLRHGCLAATLSPATKTMWATRFFAQFRPFSAIRKAATVSSERTCGTCPALWERENRRLSVGESSAAGMSESQPLLLPLPSGEGRGEGDGADLLCRDPDFCNRLPKSEIRNEFQQTEIGRTGDRNRENFVAACGEFPGQNFDRGLRGLRGCERRNPCNPRNPRSNLPRLRLCRAVFFAVISPFF